MRRRCSPRRPNSPNHTFCGKHWCLTTVTNTWSGWDLMLPEDLTGRKCYAINAPILIETKAQTMVSGHLIILSMQGTWRRTPELEKLDLDGRGSMQKGSLLGRSIGRKILSCTHKRRKEVFRDYKKIRLRVSWAEQAQTGSKILNSRGQPIQSFCCE
jgi:hypothetical protein